MVVLTLLNVKTTKPLKSVNIKDHAKSLKAVRKNSFLLKAISNREAKARKLVKSLILLKMAKKKSKVSVSKETQENSKREVVHVPVRNTLEMKEIIETLLVIINTVEAVLVADLIEAVLLNSINIETTARVTSEAETKISISNGNTTTTINQDSRTDIKTIKDLITEVVSKGKDIIMRTCILLTGLDTPNWLFRNITTTTLLSL